MPRIQKLHTENLVSAVSRVSTESHSPQKCDRAGKARGSRLRIPGHMLQAVCSPMSDEARLAAGGKGGTFSPQVLFLRELRPCDRHGTRQGFPEPCIPDLALVSAADKPMHPCPVFDVWRRDIATCSRDEGDFLRKSKQLPVYVCKRTIPRQNDSTRHVPRGWNLPSSGCPWP